MNRVFVALAALFVTVLSYGQETQKVGYADTEYILSQLPEAKKVESDLQAHGAQLEAQLKAKADEYERKMTDLRTNGAKWVDAVVQDKQQELQNLQVAFQKFQQDAETSFTKKQNDLMSPLYAKVSTAIDATAKENGYSFILTINAAGGGGQVLLYKDEQYDISKLVLKKMGVTPGATATPAKTTPATTKPQPK